MRRGRWRRCWRRIGERRVGETPGLCTATRQNKLCSRKRFAFLLSFFALPVLMLVHILIQSYSSAGRHTPPGTLCEVLARANPHKQTRTDKHTQIRGPLQNHKVTTTIYHSNKMSVEHFIIYIFFIVNWKGSVTVCVHGCLFLRFLTHAGTCVCMCVWALSSSFS